jgi:hypothetical protein
MMLGRIAQIYGRTCGVADTVLLKWLQLTGGSGGEAPPSFSGGGLQSSELWPGTAT